MRPPIALARILAYILVVFTTMVHAYAQDSVLSDPISFYRKAISPLRGNPCSMYPSCSRYGEACFNHYNFFHAATLTADRLLRCGHAHSKYLWLKNQPFARLIDPPPFISTPLHLANWPTRAVYAPARRKKKPEALIPHLINQGLHAQALAEFERLAFFSPQPLSSEAYANALRCFLALNRPQDGIAFHQSRIPAAERTNPIVALQLAKLYILLENHSPARSIIEQALRHPDAEPWRKKLYTLQAITYLPFTTRELADYQSATNAFTSAQLYNLTDSTAHTQSLRVIHQMASARIKSAPLAASLSIIPGIGYIYLGHWATGITSLLLNSALAIATWQAIQAKQWALAGIVGMLNISFYIGGFQGAYRRAKLDALTQYQTGVNQIRYINNMQNL